MRPGSEARIRADIIAAAVSLIGQGITPSFSDTGDGENHLCAYCGQDYLRGGTGSNSR